MEAKYHTRRQLMTEVAVKYIPLNAALFGKAVSVTLDIQPNANNWSFEGAVARHNNITTSSHTALFRFIAYKAFNINNSIFAWTLYPNTSFNVHVYTKHNNGTIKCTIPSTVNSKIVFSCKTGEATVNGTTYTATRVTGTGASNKHLVIGDYSLKQMEVIFWYFKAYQNGVLLRDYVPARRKSDNVIGIWDKVNDNFFTPAGGSLTEWTG
jgi:hypothetical protein